MKRPRSSFLLLCGLLLAAGAARATETTPDLDWLQDEQAAQAPTPRRGADLPPVFRAALPLRASPEIEIAAETGELLAAARAGDLARVKALLKAGAQANAADLRGERALPLAVRAGRLELARQLLAQGAAPDLRGADGLTPLGIAALAGDARLVRLLLRHGADPYLRSSTGNMPLYDAVQLERIDVIAELMAAGVDLERPSRIGLPAISTAAATGRARALDYFIRRGIDPRLPDRKKGYPPLYWALYYGQLESADVLLAHGVRTEELLVAIE